MNRIHTVSLVASLAVAGLSAGCNSQPAPPPYGTNGPSPLAMPDPSVMASAITVPAGARPLAAGTYDQIRFTVPYETGLLYIFDRDTNKVVGSTNSIQADGGRSETMTDLKNTAQGLSMTDRYQIFFAPSQPTTRPLGGGM